MKGHTRYLEVSYRRGVPYAAYYHLSSATDEQSVRVEQAEPGMVIDFAADGRPLGVELTAPALTTLDALNQVLDNLGLARATTEDFAPLRAAS